MVEGPVWVCPPIITAAMAIIDDETSYIRRLDVAADPATSPWQLAALADDPDPDVRIAVATNPSVSNLTIMRLMKDDDARVRAAASDRQDLRHRSL